MLQATVPGSAAAQSEYCFGDFCQNQSPTPTPACTNRRADGTCEQENQQAQPQPTPKQPKGQGGGGQILGTITSILVPLLAGGGGLGGGGGGGGGPASGGGGNSTDADWVDYGSVSKTKTGDVMRNDVIDDQGDIRFGDDDPSRPPPGFEPPAPSCPGPFCPLSRTNRFRAKTALGGSRL